jgi:hypothetical protein
MDIHSLKTQGYSVKHEDIVNFSSSAIDNAIAVDLSKAGWTQLLSLSLDGNGIDTIGAASLSQAGWSQLTYSNFLVGMISWNRGAGATSLSR